MIINPVVLCVTLYGFENVGYIPFEHGGIPYDVSDNLLHLAKPLNDICLEDVSVTADPLSHSN